MQKTITERVLDIILPELSKYADPGRPVNVEEHELSDDGGSRVYILYDYAGQGKYLTFNDRETPDREKYISDVIRSLQGWINKLYKN